MASQLELPIVRHPGASAIVALDERGAIAMLTQYRYAAGGFYREIPAGCRQGAESPLDCARRELREETELTAHRWDHLGAIVTMPSFCDERIELFLARELAEAEARPELDEIIHRTNRPPRGARHGADGRDCRFEDHCRAPSRARRIELNA